MSVAAAVGRAAILPAVLAAGFAGPGDARAQSADPAVVERAFAAFWAAEDEAAAAALAADVAATGVTFADALARLRAGRPYAAAPRGRVDLVHDVGGVAHPYTLVVPASYDPARPIPVRVQLHGGVGRPLAGRGRGGDQVDRLPGTREEILVAPSAWNRSMWWQRSQADNVAALLDRLKRSYNVDENRVYMTGISDGATGAYFFALRDPTPFASFLPLNGHVMVLGNPTVGADGDIFPGNAVNRPFFVVNGGRDRLYPAARVRPYVEHLARLGAEVELRVRAEAGHDTRWWPEERAGFEAFVEAHPRDPHPDRLSWQTERVDRYHRIHWLVVGALGRGEGDAVFAEDNALESGGRAARLFRRTRPAGRVDVTRRGNAFEASTRGVRAFTLLLSPDEVDFARPVTVTVNGRTAFRGRVEPDVRTLLEWAARDGDRTMLYGAALAVRVPR